VEPAAIVDSRGWPVYSCFSMEDIQLGVHQRIGELSDASNQITCPEIVKAYADSTGQVSDWHHAVGCGPFMVTDFVGGSSWHWSGTQLLRNGWTHPQKQLPYADKVSVLILPDITTALSAMRTGKIDIMYGLSNTDAANMKKSNLEITQIPVQGTNTLTIEARNWQGTFTTSSPCRIARGDRSANHSSTYYGRNCVPIFSVSSMYLTGGGLGLYLILGEELKDTYDFNQTGAKALLMLHFTKWFHNRLRGY